MEAARASLLAALEAEPWTFDFFQAVRRLEAVHRDLPRTGESGTADQDPVRFAQEPSLAFPPCTVSNYAPQANNSPTRLFVNFLGMLGPQGPLPLHLTEFARDRERNHRDPTIARFLDVFNHRAVSLFYRAWASAQMTVSYDRASFRSRAHAESIATDPDASTFVGGPTEDRWSVYVASLIGLGMPSLFDRDSMPDVFKLHFSGRLVPHVRNAEGLVASVQSYFRVPTRIVEFVGQWLQLPERYYTRLGSQRDSSVLGKAAILGQHVWDCQGKFTLVLGAMKLDDYERMLPNSDSEGRLIDWVRLYAGDEFSWEARLILLEREVPKLRLGKKGRLGYTTWLLTTQPGDKRAPEHAAPKPLGRDPDDLVLRPHPIISDGPKERPTFWNSAGARFATQIP
jgi:type VI secretion system protein ImpH